MNVTTLTWIWQPNIVSTGGKSVTERTGHRDIAVIDKVSIFRIEASGVDATKCWVEPGVRVDGNAVPQNDRPWSCTPIWKASCSKVPINNAKDCQYVAIRCGDTVLLNVKTSGPNQLRLF